MLFQAGKVRAKGVKAVSNTRDRFRNRVNSGMDGLLCQDKPMTSGRSESIPMIMMLGGPVFWAELDKRSLL